jgi:hypothetical protein
MFTRPGQGVGVKETVIIPPLALEELPGRSLHTRFTSKPLDSRKYATVKPITPQPKTPTFNPVHQTIEVYLREGKKLKEGLEEARVYVPFFSSLALAGVVVAA